MTEAVVRATSQAGMTDLVSAGRSAGTGSRGANVVVVATVVVVVVVGSVVGAAVVTGTVVVTAARRVVCVTALGTVVTGDVCGGAVGKTGGSGGSGCSWAAPAPPGARNERMATAIVDPSANFLCRRIPLILNGWRLAWVDVFLDQDVSVACH